MIRSIKFTKFSGTNGYKDGLNVYIYLVSVVPSWSSTWHQTGRWACRKAEPNPTRQPHKAGRSLYDSRQLATKHFFPPLILGLGLRAWRSRQTVVVASSLQAGEGSGRWMSRQGFVGRARDGNGCLVPADRLGTANPITCATTTNRVEDQQDFLPFFRNQEAE
jgi:hypothetical protein